MQDFLEPFEGQISSTRNGTPLSALCEKLLATFVRNKAEVATVRCDKCGYESEVMYRCLWQLSRKDSWKHDVIVHKQNGDVLLIRKESR